MASLRFYLFLFANVLVGAQGSNPVVRVANGVLKGAWRVSPNGRTYASFHGIPYARPPFGEYRFREPQQPKPWLGVWDASKYLSECLQYDPIRKQILGSENCLYVNVDTPKLSTDALLPVFVYIHGGAFMYGSGANYNATYLMDRDMVVVTINYRLGPLGFLSTGDEVIPGNAGLKDQSLALQWVKNNIMMFGGNPDSITLTGNSAGGASVHYHYLSPMSKDTFHRGIAFSGSAFSSWTHAMKPAEKARSLAAIVGCPTANTKEMADCLKYRPAEVLVNAQIEMFEWKVHLFTPFTPTREAPNVKNPFMTQYPYHVVQAGGMQKLPLITTVTSEEGLYPAAAYQTDPTLLKDLDLRWEQLASNIFEYNDTLPLNQRSAVAARIKQYYIGKKHIDQDTFPQLVQALGDRLFAADVGRLTQMHAARSSQPTYLYRYSYRGQRSLSNIIAKNDKNYGVSHADDILLIFSFDSNTPADVQMREKLLDLIYSYAATGYCLTSGYLLWKKEFYKQVDGMAMGSPVSPIVADIFMEDFEEKALLTSTVNRRFYKRTPKIPNGQQWTPVVPGSQELNYLEIASSTEFVMKTSSDFGHRSFWDKLGFIENENFI